MFALWIGSRIVNIIHTYVAFSSDSMFTLLASKGLLILLSFDHSSNISFKLSNVVITNERIMNTLNP